MKKVFTILLIVYAQFVTGQNPLIVKALGGGVLKPTDKNQASWKNNKWNNKIFYQGSGSPTKLCVTDGTNAGTVYLTDIGNGEVIKLIPARDFIYIITNYLVSFTPFTYETQIWKSDGTATGTSLVKTMPQIASSTIGNFFVSNQRSDNFSISGNRMYFGGYDAANGVELWVTDGTNAGTYILKDIKTGTGSSNPWGFCKIGTDVFFSCTQTGLERKLWKTDGTSTGTVQVPVPEPFFMTADFAIGFVNNKMLFYAHNTVDGYEPYVSDGTAAGTFMIKNINPGGNASPASVQATDWYSNNKHSFFIANNGIANALWRTDGTTAGTIQLTSNADNVSSVTSGPSYSDIDSNNLWMLQHSTSGNSKLYKSDGTVNGTYLVAQGLNLPDNLKIFKNACWYTGKPSGSIYNIEPWRSGGNAATTNRAVDIAPGAPAVAPSNFYSSSPYGFFELNSFLYFFATPTNSTSNINLYQYTGDFTFNGSLAGGRWRDSTNWNSMMPPGITDTVFINTGTPNPLDITGAVSYAGILNFGNNASINISAVTDSLIINNSLNAAGNNNINGNGILSFRNINSNDSAAIIGTITAANIAIQGNTNLHNGNANISNNINIANGRLMLNNNNLLLNGSTASITNTATNYIVTNGTGSLQIENIGTSGRSGEVVFPVGTAANYTPAFITNAGINDLFSARAMQNLYSTYTAEVPGTAQYATSAVANTWFINEGTAGGSNVELKLQWNSSQELPSFIRTQAYLGHYTGGGWNLGTVGTASGSGPFIYSRTGITSFSPFGILNNNAALPLHFLSFSARNCNNNVCLSWETANEQNVSHFEIQRSTDGMVYMTIGTKTANNQAQNNYQHTDDITNTSAEYIYYRIKQVDNDGSSKLSPVRFILAATKTVAVFPTVVSSSFVIKNETEEKLQLQLYTALGKLVAKHAIGNGNSILSAQSLTSGTYFYTITGMNGNIINTGKIVKQ